MLFFCIFEGKKGTFSPLFRYFFPLYFLIENLYAYFDWNHFAYPPVLVPGAACPAGMPRHVFERAVERGDLLKTLVYEYISHKK